MVNAGFYESRRSAGWCAFAVEGPFICSPAGDHGSVRAMPNAAKNGTRALSERLAAKGAA